GMLLSLLRWDRNGDRRWLLAAASFVGLALTHHLTFVFLLPGALYFVLTSSHRAMFWRSALPFTAIIVSALLLYAYLPLAAYHDSQEVWGDPRNWHNFIGHITGAQYRKYMGVLSGGEFWHHIVEFAGMPRHDI